MDLNEIISPAHTAVLVIDIQKDFVSSDGKQAQSGRNIKSMQEVIVPVNKLIQYARKQQIPIIFTQFFDSLEYRSKPGRHFFEKKEKNEKIRK